MINRDDDDEDDDDFGQSLFKAAYYSTEGFTPASITSFAMGKQIYLPFLVFSSVSLVSGFDLLAFWMTPSQLLRVFFLHIHCVIEYKHDLKLSSFSYVHTFFQLCISLCQRREPISQTLYINLNLGWQKKYRVNSKASTQVTLRISTCLLLKPVTSLM